ncbi:hypothetical protein NEUTE2DRAFT_139422 [Neurospora tetrasperma FGSC 2509]|nr:hypothetical protein NEUTE2DRAFT_139422 [Neurospora tetrasperma FGSC 2509]
MDQTDHDATDWTNARKGPGGISCMQRAQSDIPCPLVPAPAPAPAPAPGMPWDEWMVFVKSGSESDQFVCFQEKSEKEMSVSGLLGIAVLQRQAAAGSQQPT